MQMGDKYMIYFIIWNSIFSQLMLRTLTTVYKKVPLKYIQYLSGAISMFKGYGRTAPQYCKFKLHK